MGKITQRELAAKYDVPACDVYNSRVEPVGVAENNRRMKLYDEKQALLCLAAFYHQRAESAMNRVRLWEDRAKRMEAAAKGKGT